MTIVVLIILAVISINAVLGENGIIRRAEQAKQYQANAEAEDNNTMDKLAEYLANTIAIEGNGGSGEIPDDTTVTTLEQAKADTMLDKTENTELKIGDDTVWIPAGFKVHEDTADTVDGGIVITDETNEFVWVPVSEGSFGDMFNTAEPALKLSGSTGVTSSYYSNLRQRSGDIYTVATVTNGAYSSTKTIREPDLLESWDKYDSYAVEAGYENLAEMAQGFVDDYTNMRASIQKYKGFYIGRYELTGTVDSPTVKAGDVLIAETAGSWYGLYKACRDVVTDDTYATSTMIWGCQWDETMNWLKNTKFKNNKDAVDSNSSSWGNYEDVSVKASDGETEIKASGTSTELETGITTYTMANKIYDLAGNYFEWTQEAGDYGTRVYRGRLLAIFRF